MYIYMCVYIYIYIHFSSPEKLLDTQLSVFPRQALKVGKPASSQDMLWIACHSSLTSLPRPAWVGSCQTL